MDRSLIDLVNDYLENDTLKLPLFHPVAVKLQELLMKPDFNMRHVEEIVLQDQSLSSHILRMSNSAFFKGLNKITTVHEAAVRLGAKQVASIAMAASQEDNYSFTIKELDGFAAKLWKHTMASALGSRWLAQKTGYSDLVDEAFLAGLLHDIGKLFILKVVESIHQPGKHELEFSKDLIMEAMDQIHPEAGYRLMKRWNLPDIYADIARDHHNAQIDTANILFCFVVVADATAKKLGFGMDPDPTIAPSTMIEAQVLGLGEVSLAELEIVMEDSMGLGAKAA